ncbi:hypothetical protein [Catenulispora yoronensis]|uniref:hypothetical protein n=1 Tax=Catenulispora yoronensis TaxID=450799 RepID=UPI0031E25F29
MNDEFVEQRPKLALVIGQWSVDDPASVGGQRDRVVSRLAHVDPAEHRGLLIFYSLDERSHPYAFPRADQRQNSRSGRIGRRRRQPHYERLRHVLY